MPRKADPANANRRSLTVQLDSDLYDQSADLIAVTHTTWGELLTAALRKELNLRLKDGGDDLAFAIKVSERYRPRS